jgi:hypothetical protein
MAYTTIDDPSAYFHTQLYTGNGSADRDITNDANAGDFKPDFLWIKTRSLSGNNHHLFNSSVGMPNHVSSDTIYQEATATNKATAFNTDGFRVQTHSSVNQSSATYVAWQWKANGGTASSNTDGDITSSVQVNTTAGFSIVTYTGNGNASAQTVGHGLGAECKLVLLRSRSINDESWRVFHESVSQSGGGNLFLNGTSALDTSDPARITSTNTTTFTLDGYHSTYDALNENSQTYLAYCFAEKKGYSKFGSYTGNNSTDGAFVYTGFKPAWILFKQTENTGGWTMKDNKRSPENPADERLLADDDPAESTGADIDFLSNGFKCRSQSNAVNEVQNYIYMAFAEHPFVSSKGVPVTAR